jgi:hypothetical protein
MEKDEDVLREDVSLEILRFPYITVAHFHFIYGTLKINFSVPSGNYMYHLL